MGLNTSSGGGNRLYATILGSDGTIRVKVDESTPGAVRRDYETPKGDKGTKWELVYKSVDGIITGIRFDDTEYGHVLNVEVTSEEGKVVLTMPTASNFAQDLMKKLPNVELGLPVKFTPFAFDTEDGKNLKGISITQNGERLKNFFHDGTKHINGMITPEKSPEEKWDSEEWKYFYSKVKKFLIKYTEENIINKLNENKTAVVNISEITSDIRDVDLESLTVDSIPF